MSDTELAKQVVDMRDRGVSWNQIGLDLALVDNASDPANYKKRAAEARKLYKKANGGKLPESTRAPRTPKEHSENGKSPKGATRTATKRAEFPPQGQAQAVLEEMSDEELLDYLRGRTVKWTIVISKNGKLYLDQDEDHTEAEYYEYEARVGRETLRVLHLDKGRAISFNEPEAGSRSIYVDRIHTVR